MANVARLKEIKQRINAHPEKFNWKTYFAVPPVGEDQFKEKTHTELCVSLPEESCGTAGCIAGWAMSLYAPERIETLGYDSLSEYDIGAELLELVEDEAAFLLLDYYTKHLDPSSYLNNYEWPKDQDGYHLFGFARRRPDELFVEANRKLDFIIAHYES